MSFSKCATKTHSSVSETETFISLTCSAKSRTPATTCYFPAKQASSWTTTSSQSRRSRSVLLGSPIRALTLLHLQHVSPKESFSCSLGVDPAVRVMYHPQSKKSKSAGSYMLASKTMGTSFRQRTTIKNTRSTALHKLVLTDQVPVSDDARIKVNVLEPTDLQIGKNAKETQVRPGVKARWAQKNANARTMEEGGGEAGLGIVQWICEIGPGASVDIDLAWDVVVPAGVEWIRRY